MIFNDGSTDKSDEIIRGLLKDSPFKTQYFFSKNQGIANVRNLALTKISGEFLLFVDSDNFLDKDYVEILYRGLNKSNADIAYARLWDFVNETDVLAGDLEYTFEKELEGNRIDNCSLIRTSKLGQAGFDRELKKLIDYDFILNLIINEKAKPIYIQETKLNYRVLENSISDHGNWDKYYKAYFSILDKYIQKIPIDVVEALKKNVETWVSGYSNLEIEKNKFMLNSQKEIDELNKALQSLKSSRSYKLGKLLLLPIRLLRRKK